jgi:uncharacterized membrane protein/mono/diheme cytochrome c family protein
MFAIAALVATVGTQLVTAAESTTASRDIGREVLSVFSAKCAACHGPDLPRPMGRFGYILDLKRLAGNPEKVIPPNPEESELWGLVQRNEMPPADSPRGALTTEQKDIIRQWIAAGAPDALPGDPKSPVAEQNSAPAADQSESVATAPAKLAAADRLLLWLGKFHLLLVHFPIALVLAAGVAEALWIVRVEMRRFGTTRSASEGVGHGDRSCFGWVSILPTKSKSNPLESVRFCLWLAALAAIPTAAAGWLFAAAGNGASSPEILTAHRWLGTVAAAWLAIAAVFAERDARRGLRSNFVRVWLLLGILTTAITAHLGGLLARGADYFNF